MTVDHGETNQKGAGQWLALATRSRHEKLAHAVLQSKGYRTSLPLMRLTRKRRSGTDWEVQLPLIPGYVFVARNRQDLPLMVSTPGVVRIVGFGRQPGIIEEIEIEALERIAASGLPVADCGYAREGETVELIDGPLKGIHGIVQRNAVATRLIVGIELLQRSVTVEIEGSWAVPMRSRTLCRQPGTSIFN